MEYSLIGKIVKLSDLVQVSDKFKKREVVVKTDGRYPQFVTFVFAQIKASLLEGFKIGQDVKVFFNVHGRQSPINGKYWNELSGWKIELVPNEEDRLPPPIDQYAVDK